MACSLSVFQQLSGINAIMFYSTTIFGDSTTGLTPNDQAAIVNAVNCIAVIPSTLMLNKAGRKTLRLVWTLMGGLFTLLVGISTASSWAKIKLVCTMLFVAAFEFGPGPIVWLYNGEICTD